VRRALPLLPVIAVLVLGACAEGKTASRGDCTDADPTLALPSVPPDVVDCDSKDAKSRVVNQVELPSECGRAEGRIRLEQGGAVYCVVALPGRTFRDQLEDVERKRDDEFRKQTEELKKKLRENGGELP
jgi:hypothetical protein